MPTTNQTKTKDRKEEPQRAVIYLSEPVPDDPNEPRDERTIDQQVVLCRYAAKALDLEVIGEFTDAWPELSTRPGLHQAMEAVRTQRLDFLIVSSLERLAEGYYDTVKVAWHLGRAGTVPVPAKVGFELLQRDTRPS
jgi:hypothetical protein